MGNKQVWCCIDRTGITTHLLGAALGAALLVFCVRAGAVVGKVDVVIPADVVNQLGGQLSLDALGLNTQQENSDAPTYWTVKAWDDGTAEAGTGGSNLSGNPEGTTGGLKVTFEADRPTNIAGRNRYQLFNVYNPETRDIAFTAFFDASGNGHQLPNNAVILNTLPGLTGQFDPSNVPRLPARGDPEYNVDLKKLLGQFLDNPVVFDVPGGDPTSFQQGFAGQPVYDPALVSGDLQNLLGDGATVEQDSCTEGQPFGLAVDGVLSTFISTSHAGDPPDTGKAPNVYNESGQELDPGDIQFAGFDEDNLFLSDAFDLDSFSFDRAFNVTSGWSSRTFVPPSTLRSGSRTFEEAPLEIFADGFESGDTSSWSTQIP